MTIPHIFFADSPSLGSRAVRLVTRGKFSHCGFYDAGSGTVIDSLTSHGVTEYPLLSLRYYFPKVEIYEFNTFSRSLLSRVRLELGKPYDWTAIFSWGFHRNWQEDSKWYCSELVAAMLLDYTIPLDIHNRNRVSPQALYNSVLSYSTRRIL